MAILVLQKPFSDFDCIFHSVIFLKVGPDKIYAQVGRATVAQKKLVGWPKIFPENSADFFGVNFLGKVLVGNFQMHNAKIFVANYIEKYSKSFRAKCRPSLRRTN